MPLVRLLLGLVFVLVGVVWARKTYLAHRGRQKRGVVAPVNDFISAAPIDAVLIIALLFLGILLIVGYWSAR
jgi:hypothetical protein